MQSTVRPRTNRRRMLGTILKIALAVSLIGVILAQTSIADLIALWGKISLPWLLGGILAFYATIWIMARRYWLLLGKNIPFSEFLSLVIVQTVLGNMVATSAGAVSYIAILQNKHGISTHEGFISLLISRLGDMLALLLGLIWASWMVWPQIAALHWVVVIIAAGLAGGLLIVVLVASLRQPFVNLIGRIAHLLHLDRFHIIMRIIEFLAKLAQYDTQMLRKRFGAFLIYSLLNLICMTIFSYCNIHMFNIPVDIFPVLLIVVLSQITVLIPIQVFGGLGVYDLTSMYLYGLFGFIQSQISPAIIGIRIIFYFINIILFLYVPIQEKLHQYTTRQVSIL